MLELDAGVPAAITAFLAGPAVSRSWTKNAKRRDVVPGAGE